VSKTTCRKSFTILFFLLSGLVSSFAAAKPLATIIGKSAGKLIFVEVRVNGAGPFWFCLDSGAAHSVVDPYIVKQANLQTLRSSTITGTGQGAVPIQHAAPAILSLGSLRLKVEEPWVIDLSGVPIPKWTHGLIGADFFENFVVEVDPEKPSLRFFDAKKFVPPRDSTVVPLIVENHRLFLTAKIEANDYLSAERKLRIDLGSEDSVADELVKKGSKVSTSTLGQGLGQNYQGQSGLLKAVQLGPFRFERVWGPGAPHPAIGMELFRRFTMTFDASRAKLYLKPNRHINEPIPEPQGSGTEPQALKPSETEPH
jgi:Aspartyl protease